MGLVDLAKLSALMSRLGRKPSSAPDRRVRERHDLVSAGGQTYDLFEPRKPPRRVIVALHGVTANGKDDHRLQHFARCLAISRTICAVPHFAGLANMREDRADVEALAALIVELADKHSRPVGIVGFSYGGSYGLLAAGTAQAAAQTDFMLSFGAYHSLLDLNAWLRSRPDRPPRNEEEWDNLIYFNLCLAHRHRDRLGLSASLQGEIEALLLAYCHEATAAEKRRFYDEHLSGRDLFRLDGEACDPALWEALSPAGQLAGVRCPVGLIHDSRDTLIPPEQGQAIHAELEREVPGVSHQLLVTPLMNHVTLSTAFRVGELRRLGAMLTPLVRA